MKKTAAQWGAATLSSVIFFTQVLVSPASVQAAELDFWRSRALTQSAAAQTSKITPPLITSVSALPFLTENITRFAHIDSSVQPKAHQPTLVLIQDVHHNIEAQRNIGEVLKRAKDVVIGVEAAHGPFDFQPFRSFPVPAAAKNVGDYLLSRNLISAVSWAGLSAEQPLPTVVGVDDPQLYQTNIEAYRQAEPQQAKAQKDIDGQLVQLEQSLAQLSPASRKLFAGLLAFHRGENTVQDYLQLLADGKSVADLPALNSFLHAIELEKKLNIGQAEKERDLILATLAHFNPPAVNQLAQAAQAVSIGQLSGVEFYQAFETVLSQNSIHLAKYPALAFYIGYLKAADQLDRGGLFVELATLRRRAIENRTASSDREILTRLSAVLLADKLVKFELTPEEWKEWSALAEKPAGTAAFESFYAMAEARNEKMAENLLAALIREKKQTAMLVAGGFHTSGLAPLFRQKGFSVMVVTPKFDVAAAGSGSEYLKTFLHDSTPLPQILRGEKITLGDAAEVVGPKQSMPGRAPRLVTRTIALLFVALALHARVGAAQTTEALQRIVPQAQTTYLSEGMAKVDLGDDAAWTVQDFGDSVVPTRWPEAGRFENVPSVGNVGVRPANTPGFEWPEFLKNNLALIGILAGVFIVPIMNFIVWPVVKAAAKFPFRGPHSIEEAFQIIENNRFFDIKRAARFLLRHEQGLDNHPEQYLRLMQIMDQRTFMPKGWYAVGTVLATDGALKNITQLYQNGDENVRTLVKKTLKNLMQWQVLSFAKYVSFWKNVGVTGFKDNVKLFFARALLWFFSSPPKKEVEAKGKTSVKVQKAAAVLFALALPTFFGNATPNTTGNAWIYPVYAIMVLGMALGVRPIGSIIGYLKSEAGKPDVRRRQQAIGFHHLVMSLGGLLNGLAKMGEEDQVKQKQLIREALAAAEANHLESTLKGDELRRYKDVKSRAMRMLSIANKAIKKSGKMKMAIAFLILSPALWFVPLHHALSAKYFSLAFVTVSVVLGMTASHVPTYKISANPIGEYYLADEKQTKALMPQLETMSKGRDKEFLAGKAINVGFPGKLIVGGEEIMVQRLTLQKMGDALFIRDAFNDENSVFHAFPRIKLQVELSPYGHQMVDVRENNFFLYVSEHIQEDVMKPFLAGRQNIWIPFNGTLIIGGEEKNVTAILIQHAIQRLFILDAHFNDRTIYSNAFPFPRPGANAAQDSADEDPGQGIIGQGNSNEPFDPEMEVGGWDDTADEEAAAPISPLQTAIDNTKSQGTARPPAGIEFHVSDVVEKFIKKLIEEQESRGEHLALGVLSLAQKRTKPSVTAIIASAFSNQEMGADVRHWIFQFVDKIRAKDKNLGHATKMGALAVEFIAPLDKHIQRLRQSGMGYTPNMKPPITPVILLFAAFLGGMAWANYGGSVHPETVAKALKAMGALAFVLGIVRSRGNGRGNGGRGNGGPGRENNGEEWQRMRRVIESTLRSYGRLIPNRVALEEVLKAQSKHRGPAWTVDLNDWRIPNELRRYQVEYSDFAEAGPHFSTADLEDFYRGIIKVYWEAAFENETAQTVDIAGGAFAGMHWRNLKERMRRVLDNHPTDIEYLHRTDRVFAIGLDGLIALGGMEKEYPRRKGYENERAHLPNRAQARQHASGDNIFYLRNPHQEDAYIGFDLIGHLKADPEFQPYLTRLIHLFNRVTIVLDKSVKESEVFYTYRAHYRRIKAIDTIRVHINPDYAHAYPALINALFHALVVADTIPVAPNMHLGQWKVFTNSRYMSWRARARMLIFQIRNNWPLANIDLTVHEMVADLGGIRLNEYGYLGETSPLYELIRTDLVKARTPLKELSVQDQKDRSNILEKYGFMVRIAKKIMSGLTPSEIERWKQSMIYGALLILPFGSGKSHVPVLLSYGMLLAVVGVIAYSRKAREHVPIYPKVDDTLRAYGRYISNRISLEEALRAQGVDVSYISQELDDLTNELPFFNALDGIVSSPEFEPFYRAMMRNYWQAVFDENQHRVNMSQRMSDTFDRSRLKKILKRMSEYPRWVNLLRQYDPVFAQVIVDADTGIRMNGHAVDLVSADFVFRENRQMDKNIFAVEPKADGSKDELEQIVNQLTSDPHFHPFLTRLIHMLHDRRVINISFDKNVKESELRVDIEVSKGVYPKGIKAIFIGINPGADDPYFLVVKELFKAMVISDLVGVRSFTAEQIEVLLKSSYVKWRALARLYVILSTTGWMGERKDKAEKELGKLKKATRAENTSYEIFNERHQKLYKAIQDDLASSATPNGPDFVPSSEALRRGGSILWWNIFRGGVVGAFLLLPFKVYAVINVALGLAGVIAVVAAIGLLINYARHYISSWRKSPVEEVQPQAEFPLRLNEMAVSEIRNRRPSLPVATKVQTNSLSVHNVAEINALIKKAQNEGDNKKLDLLKIRIARIVRQIELANEGKGAVLLVGVKDMEDLHGTFAGADFNGTNVFFAEEKIGNPLKIVSDNWKQYSEVHIYALNDAFWNFNPTDIDGFGSLQPWQAAKLIVEMMEWDKGESIDVSARVQNEILGALMRLRAA